MGIWDTLTDIFSPLFNTDGTPMLDSCIDVTGNAYGITDSVLNSEGGIFDSSSSFNCFDS